MAQIAKVFVYAEKFKGEPKESNFVLKEELLDPLKDGEFLAEAMYFGINAGLRAYGDYPVGSIIIGHQVAKVIESKSESFPVGSIIYGSFGWRSLTVVNPEKFAKHQLYVLPDLGSLSSSLCVGYLGMPGNSAYFGFLEICQPKEGETVVVTGAAGSVGSLVGQIAKVKGCKVIGFAGSDDKCKWLEDELHFDKAINYKNCDMAKALKEAAPEGVDCYFDNVGGELSFTIISQMNVFGRISVCGAVSEYNCDQEFKVSSIHRLLIFKQLTMQGFVVYRWSDRWMEGISQMLKWIQEGKLKCHETITLGFENLPKAFIEVLQGKNFGKAVVKV